MKKIFLFLAIFVLMGASCNSQLATEDTQKPLDNPEDDVLSMEIIDQLTPPANDWVTTTIVSWNTPEYGRIYANVGSSPSNIFPCNWIQDVGTSFYDRNGELMGSCFTQPSDLHPEWSECSTLQDLDYHNADYISEAALERCPKAK